MGGRPAGKADVGAGARAPALSAGPAVGASRETMKQESSRRAVWGKRREGPRTAYRREGLVVCWSQGVMPGGERERAGVLEGEQRERGA